MLYNFQRCKTNFMGVMLPMKNHSNIRLSPFHSARSFSAQQPIPFSICDLHTLLFYSIPFHFHFALWNRYTFIIVRHNISNYFSSQLSEWQYARGITQPREFVWNSPSNPFIIHLCAFAFRLCFSATSTFPKWIPVPCDVIMLWLQ